MRTVVEAQTFRRSASGVWSEDERLEFISWIAANENAGDVIQGSGGLRKVRWTRPGTGKSGGARIIYFNRSERGDLVLLLVYVKAKFDDIPLKTLLKLKEAIDGA